MYNPGMNPPDNISGGGSKMMFGNMSLYSGMPYPLASTIISRYNERYANEITSNQYVYFEFMWDVEFGPEQGNSRIMRGQKFADLSAMTTFINNNIANNGSNTTESVVMRCYATISSDIDGISKIYGINRFFSSLKGRNNYKVHLATYYECTSSAAAHWPKEDDFTADIWDAFTFSGFVDKLDPIAVANAKRSIWFPTTHNKIHGLLKDGQNLSFDNGETKGRYAYDWGSSSWVSVVSAGTPSYSVADKKIVTLVPNGTSYDISGSDNISDNGYSNNGSMIRVYRFNGGNTTGLYIKPIGVDVFITNHIHNQNNLRLYMVAYNGTNDLMPRIFRLDTIPGISINNLSSDIGFRIMKHHIIQDLINTDIFAHIGQTRQKSFRFFLGDGNGNVSPLSVSVTPKVLRTGAKTKMLVN